MRPTSALVALITAAPAVSACGVTPLPEAAPTCHALTEVAEAFPTADAAGRTAEEGWGIGPSLSEATDDTWSLTTWTVLSSRRVTTEPGVTEDGTPCLDALDGWDGLVTAELTLDGEAFCTLAQERLSLPVDTRASASWSTRCRVHDALPPPMEQALADATASWTALDEVWLHLEADDTVVLSTVAHGVGEDGRPEVVTAWSSDEG